MAGLLGTQFDTGDEAAKDPIEKTSCRPDFQGFIYGGPYRNAEFNSQTPPAFLLCAYDDNGNAANEANLFLKLKDAKVPAELHVYGTGGHGFGVRADRSIAVETWPARFRDWMNDIGMLKKKQ